MVLTGRLRSSLDRIAPPTSGRLSLRAFLLAGAGAGAVGWTGTQLLTWTAPPAAASLATALWVVLAGAFVGLTVRHGPDEIRFSDPMLVWGTVNGTATALTFAGLAGLVSARLAFWQTWVAASAVGYCWTGGLLEGAGETNRGRGYALTGLVGLCVLAVDTLAVGVTAPVAYLVLGVLHAVPLTLDAVTGLSAGARSTIVATVVGSLLVTGMVI
jgi:hypothetical protein